jgi:RNA polymerase sigma-70 factor (ECF subfamily)
MENNTFLLQQLGKGNKVVFKHLFEDYYHPLRGFAKKFIEDNDVCNDIVQDAFVGLWDKRNELSISSAIKSYLYSSVRNSCLNHLRHEDVKNRNEASLMALSSDWYCEDSLLEEEVHTQIYEEIKDLPERTRDVILMALNGAANADIATELDVSINTVKTLKQRGYKILRERLKGIHWVLLLLLDNGSF